MQLIETRIKQLFNTKAAFCAETGKSDNNRKNLKTTISLIYKKIKELNDWLKPLELEIQMVLKKPKREGKKENKTAHTETAD